MATRQGGQVQTPLEMPMWVSLIRVSPKVHQSGQMQAQSFLYAQYPWR